jgi:hypothetical protein
VVRLGEATTSAWEYSRIFLFYMYTSGYMTWIQTLSFGGIFSINQHALEKLLLKYLKSADRMLFCVFMY